MLYGVEASPLLVSAPANGAVVFDNSLTHNGINIASQSASDSPYLTISVWAWCADFSMSPKIVEFAEGATYWKGSLFAVRYDGKLMLNFNDEALDLVGSQDFADSSWNHVFASVDTNHAINTKLYNILLNGTADSSITAYDAGGAFDIPFNGKKFGVPTDADTLTAEYSAFRLADLWIAYGQYLTAADVTKFRTVGGSRVDLGADGSTPTGIAPTYFFKGAAADFSTNLGTGGAVSVTGTLEDSPDAPPGP